MMINIGMMSGMMGNEQRRMPASDDECLLLKNSLTFGIDHNDEGMYSDGAGLNEMV